MNKKNIVLTFLIFLSFFLIIMGGIAISKYKNVSKIDIEQEILSTQPEVINVYFPRLPDMKFAGEKVELSEGLSREEKVRVVINKLSNGPENEQLLSIMPDDTILNKVSIKNRIAYIDFSHEFIENHPGGSVGEYNTLYSIVNSLTEIDGIDGVDFSIQGEKFKTYKGHCDFSEPLYRE